jgi:hypothetical protein
VASAAAGLLTLLMGGVAAAQPAVPSPVRASADAAPAPAPAPAKPASVPGVPALAMDPGTAAPPAAGASAPDASLDTRIQQVKAEVLRLNRDLLVLEEELLFPASTQVAVFVSMDVGVLFELGSVQVLLDGQVVSNHLYTAQELKALQRGGVQRLFLGNLKTGKHELVAFFTGQGPHARDYKRGATVEFDKDQQPRYVELQIRDRQQKLQPEFEVKVWP